MKPASRDHMPAPSGAPSFGAVIVFLSLFFLVYGGVHVFLYLRVANAFAMAGPGATGILLLIVLMVPMPVAVRFLERSGFETAARLSAITGYVWMGFVFLLFFFLIAMDVAGFALDVVYSYAGGEIGACILPEPSATAFAFLITAASLLYGMVRASRVRVRRLTIETSGRSAGDGILTICQISDLHLGILVGEKMVRRIVTLIRAENPDIVVCTGDLVDGEIRIHLEKPAELLASVTPRYGKYLVPGNHEYFAGIAKAMRFAAASGFRVLRGETISIPGVISIAGVDDPTGRLYGWYENVPEDDLLGGMPRAPFSLLLKHQPDVRDSACGHFDLQLSGHTHGGQIFPFGFLTRIRYRYNVGLFALPRGSQIYVSRGAGTWGPPVRLGSPPEITVIQVVPER